MTPGVTKAGLNKCYTVVRDLTKMNLLKETTLPYQHETPRQFQDSLLKFKIFNLVNQIYQSQSRKIDFLYEREGRR